MSRRTLSALILFAVSVAAYGMKMTTARPEPASLVHVPFEMSTSSAVASAGSSVFSSTSSQASSSPSATTNATVVRVVDGDTIVVSIDGTEQKVRLIGIDTPETVDPRKTVQCFGKEASAHTHALLDGQTVRLEADPTQDSHDKYGRLLRYVYLSDGTFINKSLVRDGYAHEYTYRVPYTYQKEFKQAQVEARTEKRGLWADDACATGVVL